MSMRLSGTIVGLCLALSVTMAHAAVYKWKDAQGRVHYGDQPKQAAEKIKGGPANSEAAPEDQAESEEAEAEKQRRIAECGNKRDQLANYKKATRIVETDSLGKEKEFSAEERLQLIDKTEKQIVANCGELTPDSAAN